MKRTGAIVIVAAFLASCNATRYVEPLEKGEHAVSVGLGGPVIDFGGVPLVIPLSNIGYGYGLDSNLTVHGGLHTTSLLFYNFHVDAGVTWQPFESKNKWVPNLSLTPSFNFVRDFNSPNSKLWPSLDINGFWSYGDNGNYFYSGMGNWFEPEAFRSSNRETLEQWLPSVHLGTVFKLKRYQFGFEARWMGLNAQIDYSFVDFKPLRSPGAYGLYFNVLRRF